MKKIRKGQGLPAVLAFGLAVVFGLLAIGCGATNPGVLPGTADHIYLQRTEAYKNTQRTFFIPANRAVELIDQTFNESLMPQPPAAIVGRWYLFSFPVHRCILLNGYYVNGDTGEVEYRQPPFEVQWSLLGTPFFAKNSGYPDYATWEKFVVVPEHRNPREQDLIGGVALDTPYYLSFPGGARSGSSYPYYVDDHHRRPDGVLVKGTRVAPLSQEKNYLRVKNKGADEAVWVPVDDVILTGNSG